MRARRLILVLLSVTATLAVAPTAFAVPAAPSFALRPVHYDPALPETKSYFVFDAQLGSTIHDTVRVVNVGTASGTVKLYAVDATTGQTSGTVYRNAGDPRRDVGRWIALSAPTLTLAPGQSQIVSFTLSVPSGASAGDHVGGIVGENEALTKGSSSGALQIKIKHLTVDAVVVRIPGAAAAGLSLSRVAAAGGHGYQFLHLGLANTGAIMIKPTGTLVVRTAAGETIVRKQLQLDTLIPGTSIAYPVSLSAALQPGSYRAVVVLHYGNRVLVDGQGIGGPLTLSHTFPFKVSGAQYTQVFKGTPQLTQTGSKFPSLLVVLSLLVATVAVLALAGVVLVTRRRPLLR